jgi:hypothetical protein
MILNIQTPYGKSYKVSEDGRINGSNTWRLLGIRHTRKTSTFIPLAALFEPGVIEATQWRFKTSGNPTWTGEDLDHGTRRTWGNTRYHGIRFCWLTEEG